MLAKKSLGQNFLMHRQTAARIVNAAGFQAGATVVEVGPGTGMLTKELLAAGAKVHAIEADRELIPVLEESFATEIQSGKLVLHHSDIRTFSIETLPQPYHVVANIPYYITGEIIRLFLSHTHQPASMTLLVQKEVAVRVARNKKESLLSLSIKVYGKPSFCFGVPRGAFKPAPNVDSAVIHISDISKKSFDSVASEEHFFSVLRAGFAHKRKQLAKNLEERWGRPAAEAALTSLTISPKTRAEDLSIETWLTLSKALAR